LGTEKRSIDGYQFKSRILYQSTGLLTGARSPHFVKENLHLMPNLTLSHASRQWESCLGSKDYELKERIGEVSELSVSKGGNQAKCQVEGVFSFPPPFDWITLPRAQATPDHGREKQYKHAKAYRLQ
jgi:hypothetical protein